MKNMYMSWEHGTTLSGSATASELNTLIGSVSCINMSSKIQTNNTRTVDKRTKEFVNQLISCAHMFKPWLYRS